MAISHIVRLLVRCFQLRQKVFCVPAAILMDLDGTFGKIRIIRMISDCLYYERFIQNHNPDGFRSCFCVM